MTVPRFRGWGRIRSESLPNRTAGGRVDGLFGLQKSRKEIIDLGEIEMEMEMDRTKKNKIKKSKHDMQQIGFIFKRIEVLRCYILSIIITCRF